VGELASGRAGTPGPPARNVSVVMGTRNLYWILFSSSLATDAGIG
jgi:hypothetical protein